ncbi:ectoine hydroxylase-related dioxygenase (phytanoyl-CoA dioxygenase family) [Chryseobacterium bernardetii]|uniref:Ectoine hydroxylase-related dioxygenase (Phytanoyl-CoA dioxygenase family) n=2 Tax=Chryseobacterium TaxID=59732 RepID=A0A543EMI9_9FLAO|nr:MULTISPECIES: phytanoyl-CoA dioxygenase family protein [Chryseobacterium]MDR6369198.1 ectoine hydroxylase-related dioxygenase (phytanoyl-CoA dioxygenase family) [Chryseobacterium vietnamense]MDR6439880.1 ectoine hydroxylase-related dioxygenase (phytanoyl-CoA dioxygenase family) [Chryseobacterium bernardetii]TQM22801.1 ectoine hydroxylase-related dioxygenase (phytanoyl-CoA dioxygenase family) [Chryseobacterium aquifrigidense]
MSLNNLKNHKSHIEEYGFAVINNVFSQKELEDINLVLKNIDTSKENFRKSEDLFAIRQFLKEVPEIKDLVFNENIREVIKEIFGEKYFVVKSIYFDKPETSNWYVAYHQDLTISVDKKLELAGFGPWTTKQNQFAVQPPLNVLENIYTIRIHLDDTDENNGALKVVPQSHAKGIYRPETIDWTVETEEICNVEKGGIMLMKPLTLHGSNRTTNGKKRRVIHIEFSDMELPEVLQWSERMN